MGSLEEGLTREPPTAMLVVASSSTLSCHSFIYKRDSTLKYIKIHIVITKSDLHLFSIEYKHY